MVRRFLAALILCLAVPLSGHAAGTFSSFPAATEPLVGSEVVPMDQGSGCATQTAPCTTSQAPSARVGQPVQVSNCSTVATPFAYQFCIDTSTSPVSLKRYIGSSWAVLGYFDTANGLWDGTIGGGSPTSLASGATTDLGSVASSIINITGNIGISSFGATAPTGTSKIVVYQTGGNLLTNSGTLIVPGGTNFTTAAGDVMVATALGGASWRISAYQQNVAPGSSSTPTGAAGGALSGTYPNPSIAAGAVTGTMIANTTIVDGNVVAGTLTGARVAAGTITGTNLAAATVTNSNLAQMAAHSIKCNTSGSTGSAADCTTAQVGGFLYTIPTITTYLTGSGTYTTPTGPSPLYVHVRMVGGGGGGGGGNASNGGTGGDTTFGSLTASGATGTSGGGAATNGDVQVVGGCGSIGWYNQAANTAAGGGQGADTPFGGGGRGGYGADGANAVNNSGGGGGGGGVDANGSYLQGGTGGCAGGYLEKWITSPSSTYAYAVGAGGTGGAGGASGHSGGVGGTGRIIVEAHFQ